MSQKPHRPAGGPARSKQGLAQLAALFDDSKKSAEQGNRSPSAPAGKSGRFHPTAPYNFVPFCPYPLRRYESSADLPGHDRLDPNLLSGEIKVTLTAETPIFISNGYKAGDNIPPDFFRGADGQYQIPGSTLRGLIRSNMQILGFGLVRPEEDFANLRMYYRSLANARRSVGGDLSSDYTKLLDIRSERCEDGKNRSNPRNVQAGYLCCKGNEYFIQPVSAPLMIRRKSPVAAAYRDTWARIVPVWYKANGSRVTALSEQELPDGQKGDLLCVGRMNKQNTLYLFRYEKAGEPISLSAEEVLYYKEDFELRQNQLVGTNISKADPDHWALPKDGQSKPVFYINRGSNGPAGVTQAGGEAHHNAVSFGVSRYLRVLYGGSLEDGLPAGQKERKETSCRFLDYPSAVMGCSHIQEGQAGYRSRISVGALTARGNPKPGAPVSLMLAEPKPTFFAGYVTPKRDANQPGPGTAQHYNSPDFKLRGVKQYWFKPAQTLPAESIKKNVASTLRPLPEGTAFTGTVRYRNLHPDELGLLLWCLQPGADCRQNLGMGKPYGYGRVRIAIQLCETDCAALYRSFAPAPPAAAPEARLQELIKTYQTQAEEMLAWQYPETQKKKQPLNKLPHIRDFLDMKRCIHTKDNADTVRYMELKDFQNLPEPLETAHQHLMHLSK